MYQMKDAFEHDLKVPCSVLGDGQFGSMDDDGHRSIKRMSVGMVQTLMSRLEQSTIEKQFERLFESKSKANDKVIAAQRKAGVSKTVLANLIDKHSKQMTAAAKPMMAEATKRHREQVAIREQTIRLLAIFEFVILEEAHESSGNSFFEVLRHCKNANYRLALTGTPFMKDDEEANMRLMASSGPIAIKVSEKLLIDRGILATPIFKIVDLKTSPPKLHRSSPWDAAYRIGIVDNVERNLHIADEVVRASSYGLSSMVLTQHKRHGDILLDLFEAKGLRAEYIQGADDQTERKKALYKLATNQIDVLIGTTILDVGVDVPAVGLIVLAGGGKAEVALRQRIGRGLRCKKRGPNIAFVIDFNDPFNNHTKNHANQRKQIITDTEGFGENIVPRDFDFRALGFERKVA